MNDVTCPNSEPDAPSPPPVLVDHDWRTVEDRRDRAEQTEAARWADLEETESGDEALTISEIPLYGAAPSCGPISF
jgi:hypothetical protein